MSTDGDRFAHRRTSMRLLLATVFLAFVFLTAVSALLALLTPDPLAPRGAADSQAPVVPVDHDAAQTVSLTVTLTESTPLHSPREGVVTASTCAAGSQWRHGDTPISVDGTPILALATPHPSWRDLHLADHGSDVAEVVDALRALGADLPAGDVVTAEVVDSWNTLLTERGVPSVPGQIMLMEDTMWLPATDTTIGECPDSGRLGSRTSVGDALAVTTPRLEAVRLAATPSLPSESVDADLLLTVDGVTVPLDTDGAVTGDALEALSVTSLVTPRDPDAPPVTGTVALVEPVPAWSVPVTMLGSTGQCEWIEGTDGTIHRVELLVSSLGAVTIRPLGDIPLPGIVTTPREREPAACGS